MSSGSAKPNQQNRAIPMEQNVNLVSIACHHDTKIATILAMWWKVDFFNNGPLCKDCKDYSFVVVVDVDCTTNTLIWNAPKQNISLLSFVTKTQEANHNRYSQETILIKQPTQTSTNPPSQAAQSQATRRRQARREFWRQMDENPHPPRSKIPTMGMDTTAQTGDKFEKLSAKAVYKEAKTQLPMMGDKTPRRTEVANENPNNTGFRGELKATRCLSKKHCKQKKTTV